MIKLRFLPLLATALLLASCLPRDQEEIKPPKPLPPSPPIMGQAQLPPQLGAIPQQAQTIKIALLVPLSGDSVSIGNSMLDAATMATYDSYFSIPSTQIHAQIVLLPKDTGSTPSDAAAAAQQAIDQGARFIIGPLFSQSVSAVAPVAREHHISMLTFSNTKEVAGTSTYVFGFLPEQQVKRMADYAFLHGLTRVALLAPNDSYGQKIQDTLTSSYNEKGGLVAPTERYAPSPANIDAAVGRLAAYNNTTKERRFQAIFIADGGPQLRNIIASIKKSGIDLNDIKLLGTGMWDDPTIASIPEMNGAWFSSSPPDAYDAFARRFTTIYGYKPVRLASLAYDAVSIAAVLTMSNPDTGLSDAALTNPSGFDHTANGLVRLKMDGTSDRKLAIMQVTPTGFKVIDQAPTSYDFNANLVPHP